MLKQIHTISNNYRNKFGATLSTSLSNNYNNPYAERGRPTSSLRLARFVIPARQVSEYWSQGLNRNPRTLKGASYKRDSDRNFQVRWCISPRSLIPVSVIAIAAQAFTDARVIARCLGQPHSRSSHVPNRQWFGAGLTIHNTEEVV